MLPAPLKVTVNSDKNLHCQSLNSKFTEVTCLPFDKKCYIFISFYDCTLWRLWPTRQIRKTSNSDWACLSRTNPERFIFNLSLKKDNLQVSAEETQPSQWQMCLLKVEYKTGLVWVYPLTLFSSKYCWLLTEWTTTLHVHYKIIKKDFQIEKKFSTVTRNLLFKRTTLQRRLFEITGQCSWINFVILHILKHE